MQTLISLVSILAPIFLSSIISSLVSYRLGKREGIRTMQQEMEKKIAALKVGDLLPLNSLANSSPLGSPASDESK